MSARRVWVVGAGRRVRETSLPALDSLAGELDVAGILARSAREIEIGGRARRVRALGEVQPSELRADDVVYVAVGKEAVPAVLAALARFDRRDKELLIDTPVLRMKDARHLALLAGWKRASVAEDVAFLPWHAVAIAAAGAPRRVLFERAAYAYHGLAQAKALLGNQCVVRARRTRDGHSARREIELENGAIAISIEPRDYASGRVVLEGARARVSDRIDPGEPGVLLEALVENGICVGVQAGSDRELLAPNERALTAGDPPNASVTARMAAMKRVAFRRLLQQVARGAGAYPLQQGLDDMAADWFLERFGRYRPNAFTDLARPSARALWGALGSLG